MAIFNIIFKLTKAFGFIIALFVLSYVITSVTYYSFYSKEEIYNNIDFIHNESIKYIDIKYKEEITLEIEVTKEISDEYLLAYVYTYYDEHKQTINVYLLSEEKILVINKYGEAFIQK